MLGALSMGNEGSHQGPQLGLFTRAWWHAQVSSSGFSLSLGPALWLQNDSSKCEILFVLLTAYPLG